MHPNKNKSQVTWADYEKPCPKDVVDKELGLSGTRDIGLAYRSEIQMLERQAAAECARNAESIVTLDRARAASSEAGNAPNPTANVASGSNTTAQCL